MVDRHELISKEYRDTRVVEEASRHNKSIFFPIKYSKGLLIFITEFGTTLFKGTDTLHYWLDTPLFFCSVFVCEVFIGDFFARLLCFVNF